MVFLSQENVDNIAIWCYIDIRKHQNGVKKEAKEHEAIKKQN